MLIHRAVGSGIQVSFHLAESLWFCRADPNQLESAILNLAINARDAMPKGGSLRVTTENSTLDDAAAAHLGDIIPGRYVVVTLTDTGTGMPDDVLTRVFEPFFTTKEVGKGSGLGLSQVYGFARQSGGHIAVQSKVGKGTDVRLYLPWTEPVQVNIPKVEAPPAGGRASHQDPYRGGRQRPARTCHPPRRGARIWRVFGQRRCRGHSKARNGA